MFIFQFTTLIVTLIRESITEFSDTDISIITKLYLKRDSCILQPPTAQISYLYKTTKIVYALIIEIRLSLYIFFYFTSNTKELSTSSQPFSHTHIPAIPHPMNKRPPLSILFHELNFTTVFSFSPIPARQ